MLDVVFIYVRDAFIIPGIGVEKMFFLVGGFTSILVIQAIFLKDEVIIGKTLE
jgi:hypothetical protein